MIIHDHPFIDPNADLYDEDGYHPYDITPARGRRRHLNGEWDDYIILYADVFIHLLVTENAAHLRDEEPVWQCTECEYIGKDKRGLTVHLARRHGLRSERSQYFAERYYGPTPTDLTEEETCS